MRAGQGENKTRTNNFRLKDSNAAKKAGENFPASGRSAPPRQTAGKSWREGPTPPRLSRAAVEKGIAKCSLERVWTAKCSFSDCGLETRPRQPPRGPGRTKALLSHAFPVSEGILHLPSRIKHTSSSFPGCWVLGTLILGQPSTQKIRNTQFCIA